MCHLPLPCVKILIVSINKTKTTIKTETRLSMSQMHVWVVQQYFPLNMKVFSSKMLLFLEASITLAAAGLQDKKIRSFKWKWYWITLRKHQSILLIKEENCWCHLNITLCIFFQRVIWFMYVMEAKLWSSHGTPMRWTNLSRSLLF